MGNALSCFDEFKFVVETTSEGSVTSAAKEAAATAGVGGYDVQGSDAASRQVIYGWIADTLRSLVCRLGTTVGGSERRLFGSSEYDKPTASDIGLPILCIGDAFDP